MEYYSAIKKNSFESILMRWMKLEPIIQSEVSQKDKKHQTHVNPWLIHINVWQKPLQYWKGISLQLIKINEKIKERKKNKEKIK